MSDDFESAFNRALKYLSQRAKSKKEVEDYLAKKGFDPQSIKYATDRLLELKFLNDEEFTNYYAKSRQLRGKSKRLITFELSKKGITKEKAGKSFEDTQSDFKTALEYIEKRMRQFERFDNEKKKKRIISRLTSRGFGWEIINKVLKKLENQT